MTFKKDYRRVHLRAPLKTFFLYEDDGYVFKSQLVNISEGGLLIKTLPHLPQINIIPVLIDLPSYPIFEKMTSEELLLLQHFLLPRKILRAKIKVVRKTDQILKEGESSVKALFVQNIGAQFKEISHEAQEAIHLYISEMSKNLIYLINFFKKTNLSSSERSVIRHLGNLIGYAETDEMNQLYKSLWQDYQSLMS